jgi:hypothetical protein
MEPRDAESHFAQKNKFAVLVLDVYRVGEWSGESTKPVIHYF